MSTYVRTTRKYAKRFRLSAADHGRLLVHYPLFKLVHESMYGSRRARLVASALVPFVGRLTIDHDVHGPGGTVRIPLRFTQNDVASFTEIFQGGEYDADFGPAVTYVDAGANTGMAAAFFATQHRLEAMLLIEANPELATKLKDMVERLPHPVAVEHVALAGRDGPLTFHIRPDHRMSSIKGDGGHTVLVPASTLRALLDRHAIDRVDILKMDIEGAEHEVLASDPAILDRVRSLVMEVHGSRSDRDSMFALVASSGFDVQVDRQGGADLLVGENRMARAPSTSRVRRCG